MKELSERAHSLSFCKLEEKVFGTIQILCKHVISTFLLPFLLSVKINQVLYHRVYNILPLLFLGAYRNFRKL